MSTLGGWVCFFLLYIENFLATGVEARLLGMDPHYSFVLFGSQAIISIIKLQGAFLDVLGFVFEDIQVFDDSFLQFFCVFREL